MDSEKKPVLGIVAEFNPFHNGHAYLIESAKEIIKRKCGVEPVTVAVMSGDFVQRGDIAIFNKHDRAEMACRNGIDLCLELPVKWSLSSAEIFAYSSVYILNSIGADFIAFGSECGDIDRLFDTAKAVSAEGFNEQVKNRMHEMPEMSYASARAKVLGDKSFEMPNDILGVEYLKAIIQMNSDLIPLVIKRIGSAHDTVSNECKEYPSASQIRDKICSGICSDYPYIPVDIKRFDTAVVSRLKMFDRDYLCSFHNAENGLGNRLYEAVRKYDTIKEICNEAKTKRFALSRIRRLVMCAVINVDDSPECKTPPYTRALSFNSSGRDYLKILKEKASIPVIVRPKDSKECGGAIHENFEAGVRAEELFMLCSKAKGYSNSKIDYQIGPIIV